MPQPLICCRLFCRAVHHTFGLTGDDLGLTKRQRMEVNFIEFLIRPIQARFCPRENRPNFGPEVTSPAITGKLADVFRRGYRRVLQARLW